jgi:hypothetical protein
MTNVKVDIDIDGTERVSPALRKGLSDGLDDAGSWLLKKGEQNAKGIVLNTDRVWRETLQKGFTTQKHGFNRYYHWKGKIRNEAKHAKIVEKGLQPAGEINRAGPSVQDILPWVDSEVTPNAAAQASAEASNIANWDPQLQALAVEYGKADVIAAFAIAQHIQDQGYAGIRFMEQTRSYLRSQTVNVKNKVEKHMNRKLREAGLK